MYSAHNLSILNSATRIVREDDDMLASTRFYDRYQQMFIGASVVQGILDLDRRYSVDPESAIREFRRKRRTWESCGGYLERITTEDIHHWISSDSYIVTEAADPDTTTAGAFSPVAQCIYKLPADEWVIPQLADPPDEIFDHELYKTIQNDGPRASALIDYLGVLPKWSDRKLAGSARFAGMLELIRQNANRASDSRIRHVIGLTFAIEGVIVPDSAGAKPRKSIRLMERFGQEEIVNQASTRAITTSTRCPPQALGRWKSAPAVLVPVNGVPYSLQVYWYCYVRTVSDVLERL
ncbi:hypothetical protein [Amycolatopsis pithecellobii]|uniref:Uncharacterized protein n=1 Tax=Amycolatopsis pithecellobii TaxID=664692 RepID=A0A6N7YRC8_9PSEU|nr:hypothetical protein [Amycolatopsis pithecellobii]MTD55587.1 hypothetical protein [Amycolatopsis pithecellobii]